MRKKPINYSRLYSHARLFEMLERRQGHPSVEVVCHKKSYSDFYFTIAGLKFKIVRTKKDRKNTYVVKSIGQKGEVITLNPEETYTLCQSLHAAITEGSF